MINTNKRILSIHEESVRTKTITKTTTRDNLYNFDLPSVKKVHVRSELSNEVKTFLDSGVSISRLGLKNEENNVFTSLINEFSAPKIMRDYDLFDSLLFSKIEDIQYLDPSIEYIKPVVSEESKFLVMESNKVMMFFF